MLYQSVEVEMRSGEPAVLLSYEWFASYAANQLGITIGKWYAFIYILIYVPFFYLFAIFKVGLLQKHITID